MTRVRISGLRSEIARFGRGLVGLNLLVLLLNTPSAFAHAEFVTADPPPGAVIDSSRRLIWLEFNEPLRLGSAAEIYGSGFRAVNGVQSALDLTRPTRLVVMLPELVPDNYTVQWTSIATDGDTVTGSYAFGVRAPLGVAGWFVPLTTGLLLVIFFVLVINSLHRRRV